MTDAARLANDTSPAADDGLWLDHEDRPIFRHKPKLIGPEIVFTLQDREIAWSDGRVSGSLPLHQIESVRLVFRPANLYTSRYRIEIRQRLGKRIWFSNISWRGMVEIDSNDAPFAAFVRRLCAAIAKASPKARFIAGEPAWRYAVVAAITAGLAVSLAYLAIAAVKTVNWGLMGLVAFVGGYTVWQMSLWLRKNRPGSFDPLALPTDLLPTVKPPRA
ncbi:hypothetical protein [Phreatobacter oligotrophus]|uniref:hypothetical protein n=1 Tax=Phreatobacter oligotrophus TaxID=1122261 RepID=UPI0023522443|nr:hypothetical protein [Phreatobacter oligotrophus]MBX9990305.1 hypothetical protein [Phreatobacter oligotrophus]